MQTQTETKPKEVVFDDQGQTVEVHHEEDPVADEARAAAAGETTPDDTEVVENAEPPKKFRIGDQEFATQDEALAFAQRQVEIDNAYQQGVREATAAIQPQQQNVTHTPEATQDLNPDELYTNPQEFLQKYEAKIISRIDQRDQLKQQSDQIWRELTYRHPELADFRQEVEGFVQHDNANVRAVIQTKGRDASYDYIATKLKAKWASYENAIKPKRALANTSGGASPTNGKGSSVTPKEPTKKPLSLDEQLRNIRKGRR